MNENIFEDASLKRKELVTLFEQVPETTVVGIVDAKGPGGGKSPPEELWSLSLSLIAWREIGGKLNQSELVIYKEVDDQELQDIQNAVEPEALISFKAKLVKNSPFGDARAQLISLLNSTVDEELEEIRNQYKQPVEISHPVFGLLTLDKSIDCFEGKANWLGKTIQISFSLDDNESPNSSIEIASSLWDEMKDWDAKVNKYAVSKLLGLKNENWLGDNTQEISAAEFVKAMTLETIAVYPDGDFEFWHNDGDLFWGHSILISGSIAEGLIDADIPG